MKPSMITLFSAIALPLTVCLGAGQDSTGSLETSIDWLARESHRLIRASVRTMDNGTKAFPPQVGIGYQAFWLRDYEYTLEGDIDAYSTEELLASARLFICSLRADGAGVDCVKYDGTPIYKPGYGSMGEYQNGAYWATPTGWFVYTLDRVDPALADRTVMDMAHHFQQYGACEWILGEQRTLPNYLASVSLPLAGIRAMLERRTGSSQGHIESAPK